MEISQESGGYDGGFSDLVEKVRDVLRRRWITLVAVSVVVFALCIGGIALITPKYTSVARVRIDPSRNVLANGDASAQLTPEAIETEVSLVGSADVARSVVEQLHLDHDPEFMAPLNRNGAPKLSPNELKDALAAELQNNLSVAREKLTYILAVRYTSKDPLQAARIANAIAAAYVRTKAGQQAGTAGKQADFLSQRAEQLNREVNQAEAAAASYRAQAGIVQDAQGNNLGTIVDQQISSLSGQLAEAESDAAAAHAKLSAARQQIASGGLDSISEVLGSQVIGDLRRQRAEVLRNVQEVQARYGERHPESIRVHDQLDAIDRQINEEARRVVGSLQATASAADARVASLRGSMGQLRGQQANDTRAAVRSDALEREAKSKQTAYDRLSQLSMQRADESKNQIASAEIAGTAAPLDAPSSPNKPLLGALSLLVALAAGAAIITLQEMMVSGLSTVEEVRTRLGMPVLAAVPKLARNASPADMLLDKPTSLFSESFRIARAAVLGVRSARDKRVIAITSALPSEGKTTTALSFARTLAINSQKTLLLECDVRRAAMREIVANPPQGPGIVELLHGEATLDQVVHPGDVEGLDHLLVQAPYFSSGDLFGGGAMEQLLSDLRERYEMIVLDLPPLVGLADGRFLAVMADVTVLCLKWNSTPADAASSALDWLHSDGANPVGVIFTMVDTSAEAIGGLYYSKKYSAYYQTA